GCIQIGGIIKLIEADKDVTLEEVEVDNNAEVEENADVQGRPKESQAQIYKIDLKHADKVLSMQDDELEPTELKEVEKKSSNKRPRRIAPSITIHTEPKSNDKGKRIMVQEPKPLKKQDQIEQDEAYAREWTTPITTATITTAPSAARRRKGVVIRDPKETIASSIIIHTEPKSKDKEKGIMVQEPKPLKKQAQIEQDEAYARELEAELNKNISWDDVIEQVQTNEKEDNAVLRYQALKRKPQTEAQARKNMMIYLRNMARFKMDYSYYYCYNYYCS
nr:hypothetical protein [Tanacetum cinerariifolium]